MLIDDAIHSHFAVLGLPPEVYVPIERSILAWLKHCGAEWTVERIKLLKALFLKRAGGESTENFKLSQRISLHSDGSPRGPFRALWSMTSGKKFPSALRVFQVSGLFTSERLTSKQWSKFVTSVESPIPYRVLPAVRVPVELQYLGQQAWRSAKYAPLHSFCGEGVPTRAPVWNRRELVSVPSSSTTVLSHLAVLNNVFEQHIAFVYPRPFERLGIKCESRASSEYRSKLRDGAVPFPVGYTGRIGLIQERGVKLRAVANPSRVYQAVLSRLGRALFSLMENSLPWDCTFDQAKGTSWVQRKLNEGNRVYSIDLSDATNQFPLELQETVISTLLQSRHKDDPELSDSLGILHHVSRARWYLPKIAQEVSGQRYVSWTKGQPLGLYPSFAMFAITHGMLLHTLEEDLGLVDSFRVLGDDVVISHESLNQSYRTALTALGCPISEVKSLNSPKLGEFAGKVVTGDGVVVAEKWKTWNSNDPLYSLRVYGPRGVSMIPSKYRDAVLWWASMPEPVGMGLNPKGIPLHVRIEKVVDMFEDVVRFPLSTGSPRLEKQSRLDLAFYDRFIDRDDAGPTLLPKNILVEECLNAIPDRELAVERLGEHLGAQSRVFEYNLSPFMRHLLDVYRSQHAVQGQHPVGKPERTWLSTMLMWYRRSLKT